MFVLADERCWLDRQRIEQLAEPLGIGRGIEIQDGVEVDVLLAQQICRAP